MADPKERWKGQSAYTEEMCERLPELFSTGKSQAWVAVQLGISNQTFDAWCKKYPRFKEAAEHGKTIAQAHGLEMLEEIGVSGAKCNASLLIFSSRHKYGLHDKLEIKTTETDKEKAKEFADLVKVEKGKIKLASK